jgi:hypothetical protein
MCGAVGAVVWWWVRQWVRQWVKQRGQPSPDVGFRECVVALGGVESAGRRARNVVVAGEGRIHLFATSFMSNGGALGPHVSSWCLAQRSAGTFEQGVSGGGATEGTTGTEGTARPARPARPARTRIAFIRGDTNNDCHLVPVVPLVQRSHRQQQWQQQWQQWQQQWQHKSRGTAYWYVCCCGVAVVLLC